VFENNVLTRFGQHTDCISPSRKPAAVASAAGTKKLSFGAEVFFTDRYSR
jgi:hypothetical protein